MILKKLHPKIHTHTKKLLQERQKKQQKQAGDTRNGDNLTCLG